MAPKKIYNVKKFVSDAALRQPTEWQVRFDSASSILPEVFFFHKKTENRSSSILCRIREGLHLGALRSLLDGDWEGAVRTWDGILASHPMDTFALHMGFFVGGISMGRPHLLRSFPARVVDRYPAHHRFRG